MSQLMSEVIEAEVESLHANEALHDVRFARTLLFAIGGLVIVAGIYAGPPPAIVFGAIMICIGWYFQAFSIPSREAKLRSARRAMGEAIAALAGSPLH